MKLKKIDQAFLQICLYNAVLVLLYKYLPIQSALAPALGTRGSV